jgi:chromosome segregation ATPase
MSEKIERIKDRINDIKKEKEELRQKHDYIIQQIKKSNDKNSQDIELLKKEIRSVAEKLERRDNTIANTRSFMSSLEKAIASLESRQNAVKVKSEEDLKIIGRELNSQMTERAKAINATLSAEMKDVLAKNLKDTQLLKDNIRKVIERNEEYEDAIAGLSGSINSLNKAISELSGKNDAIKSAVNEKMNLIEKNMNSELANVKSLEARLLKDIKDFEKFASDQKVRMEEFEADVAGKLDMFAVKKENLKKDFDIIVNNFKNIAGRVDSMKEKDAYFDHRLKNVELGLENLKKMAEENFARLNDENKVFRENLIARLNDASDKIVSRLSQGETRTSADLAKQTEDIKVFRAHVTQFINDFVNNYEKRFGNIKAEIDQTIAIIEEHEKERAKHPRAMIFE